MRPIESVETVVEQTAVEKYEQSRGELATIQAEMKEAEKALVNILATRKDPRVGWKNGEMFARVGAMLVAPADLRAAERRWVEAFRKHQEKQIESAQLKREAGLVR